MRMENSSSRCTLPPVFSTPWPMPRPKRRRIRRRIRSLIKLARSRSIPRPPEGSLTRISKSLSSASARFSPLREVICSLADRCLIVISNVYFCTSSKIINSLFVALFLYVIISSVASRRNSEELIFEGKVTVNGSVCKAPQVRITSCFIQLRVSKCY